MIHAELRETEASYNKELLRFGKDQAPRLDRTRERLERVGGKLGTSSAAEPGELSAIERFDRRWRTTP